MAKKTTTPAAATATTPATTTDAPAKKVIAQPIASTGVATLTVKGLPLVAITAAVDGTFGWRSHGKMTVKTRADANGVQGTQEQYRFKKGFADFQTAIAAAICYARRHHEIADADVAIVAYVAPERGNFEPQRLQDTAEFKAAAKLAAKFKLPTEVKKALASATPAATAKAS